MSNECAGCSCGFRYVVAEEPVEYWDGMFADSDEKQESTHALVRLIRDEVEVQPKGTIELRAETLDPGTFFLVEQFFYRVQGARALEANGGGWPSQ